jgi:hypothetical protein
MIQIDETPLSVLIVIAGCGVLTGCHVRDIRSLSSWRSASAGNEHGAKLPETPSLCPGKGKVECESMVRPQRILMAEWLKDGA